MAAALTFVYVRNLIRWIKEDRGEHTAPVRATDA
jgi:hypothetical protein